MELDDPEMQGVMPRAINQVWHYLKCDTPLTQSTLQHSQLHLHLPCPTGLPRAEAKTCP